MGIPGFMANDYRVNMQGLETISNFSLHCGIPLAYFFASDAQIAPNQSRKSVAVRFVQHSSFCTLGIFQITLQLRLVTKTQQEAL